MSWTRCLTQTHIAWCARTSCCPSRSRVAFPRHSPACFYCHSSSSRSLVHSNCARQKGRCIVRWEVPWRPRCLLCSCCTWLACWRTTGRPGRTRRLATPWTVHRTVWPVCWTTTQCPDETKTSRTVKAAWTPRWTPFGPQTFVWTSWSCPGCRVACPCLPWGPCMSESSRGWSSGLSTHWVSRAQRGTATSHSKTCLRFGSR